MNEATVPLVLLEAGTWLAKSGGVFLGAALLCCLMRGHRAATRHMIWKVATLAAFLLPLVDGVLPDYFGRVPSERKSAPSTNAAADEVLFRRPPAPSVAGLATSFSEENQPLIEAAAPAPVSIPWIKVFAVGWVVGSTLLLLRLAVSAWALARLVRHASLPSVAMTEHFRRACVEAGVDADKVRLLRMVGGHTPLTWGLIRPVVLLPENATAWEPGLLRSVLLHELTHVRRRDVLWDAMARVLVALQWPSPLAWFALASLDRERERACDTAVVAMGTGRSEYARHLLSVVAFVKPGHLAGAGTAMARTTEVEGRVRAILAPAGRPTSPLLLAAVSVFLLLAAGFAAVFGDEASSPYPPESAVALETVFLEGGPHMTVETLATRYGFEVAEREGGDGFLLRPRASGLSVPLDIAGDKGSMELRVGGVRIFTDDPVVSSEGRILLSLRTVETILDPILRPRDVGLEPIDTIIIDAGHGGNDSGGKAGGFEEKDITLAMARALQEGLKMLPLKVVLTRTGDESVSLGERKALARHYPRGILLSLHAHSAPDALRDGTETYLGAERSAASTILAVAAHGMILRETGATDGGIRAGRFALLREELPAILIETGYLTNDAERKRLVHSGDGFREGLVRALVESVRLYTGLAGTLASEEQTETGEPEEDQQPWTRFKASPSPYPQMLDIDWRRLPLADGFEFPVGGPNGEGFYTARGFKENGHLGEDWNGRGGGSTDFGLPVRSIGQGRVVLAKDVKVGWGKVIIIRHQYLDPATGKAKAVDSFYGHVGSILVMAGQAVERGQLIATIGDNNGMYAAHLNLEIRKNLAIGLDRSKFARDFTNYHDPSAFIRAMPPKPAEEGEGKGVDLPEESAADIYLKGYLSCMEAARLAKAGETKAAIAKLVEAQTIIQGVRERWPEFQVNVVSYRLKAIAEELAELRADLE